MAVSIKTEQKKHQYTQPWDDSDVVLFAEDEKFYVHSSILSFASPVFKLMLSSNVEEESEKVINLPEKRKKDILNLLNIIYPVDFAITEYSSCEGLLKLGQEFDIKRISLSVDVFLCSVNLNYSFNVFQLAEKFRLPNTQKKYIDYYIKECNDFGVDWREISAESKLKVICGRIQAITTSTSKHCSSCSRASSYCEHYLQDVVRIKDFFSLQRSAKAFSES